MPRNAAKLAGALTALVLASMPIIGVAQESADTYPSRTIRLVSSGVPGGLTDVVARVMAERLSASSAMRGQQVIVENKPGASGIIASTFVAKAPADGYTIAIADLTQTAIVPALYTKPPYQTQRDFAPVSLLGTTPFFLSVQASLGTPTLREFIAFAKAHPGKRAYGSSGSGSVHHLATETFRTRTGLEMTHVPYKSSGLSTPALIAGDIQVLFTALGAMAPHLKAGKVHLLAVASPQRTRQAPDVPTFEELGVKDVLLVPSVAALAPAGTPAPIVAKLAAEMRNAVQHPEAVKRFEGLGIDPIGSSPEAYVQQLAADIASFAQAVKISGAKAD